jgi:hypothetical protein
MTYRSIHRFGYKPAVQVREAKARQLCGTQARGREHTTGHSKGYINVAENQVTAGADREGPRQKGPVLHGYSDVKPGLELEEEIHGWVYDLEQLANRYLEASGSWAGKVWTLAISLHEQLVATVS